MAGGRISRPRFAFGCAPSGQRARMCAVGRPHVVGALRIGRGHADVRRRRQLLPHGADGRTLHVRVDRVVETLEGIRLVGDVGELGGIQGIAHGHGHQTREGRGLRQHHVQPQDLRDLGFDLELGREVEGRQALGHTAA